MKLFSKRRYVNELFSKERLVESSHAEAMEEASQEGKNQTISTIIANSGSLGLTSEQVTKIKNLFQNNNSPTLNR